MAIAIVVYFVAYLANWRTVETESDRPERMARLRAAHSRYGALAGILASSGSVVPRTFVLRGSPTTTQRQRTMFAISVEETEGGVSNSAGKNLDQKSRSLTRQVRLTLRYINVSSAAKISFLFGVGLGFVAGISLLILWALLNLFGAFAALNSVLAGISVGSSTLTGSINFTVVLGIGFLLGVLTTIVATIVGTFGAALYNFSVRIMGGTTVGFSTEV